MIFDYARALTACAEGDRQACVGLAERRNSALRRALGRLDDRMVVATSPSRTDLLPA